MIATDTPEKDAIAEKKKKENKKQIDKAKQDLFKGTMWKESNKNKKKAHVIEDSDTSDEEEFIASGSSCGGEDFISGNEVEGGKIVLDDNFLPIPRDPKENEFVLITRSKNYWQITKANVFLIWRSFRYVAFEYALNI